MHVLVIPGLTMLALADAGRERILQAAGPDATITVADSYGEALEAAGDADVIFGRIDPRLFGAAKRLRWVHAITAGADAYLFDEMRDSEVMLSGDKGLVGSHLAETAFALLLAITRRLAVAVRDGPQSWDHRVEYRSEERELEGLTMGIVGFGGTGRAIAHLAAAFGMRCIAVDREAVPASPEVPEPWGADRFEELLAASDVVASGLPLTPETRAIFNDDAFTRMKRTAILVNVTRGELVDGDALLRAIRSGEIAGAGLDVTPQEPLPPDHPLWELPTVVMTPHTAGREPVPRRAQPGPLLR